MTPPARDTFKVGDEVRHKNPGTRFRGSGRVERVFPRGDVAVRWPYWGIATHRATDLSRR